MTPPIDWFENPGLTEPTPPTITPDGRIYGHIATWNQSHVGMPGRHVKPPRSRTGYAEFHRRPIEVVGKDGTPTKIDSGLLTFDTTHAPTAGASTRSRSDLHFEHSGMLAAKVCAGEDEHGIWFSGQANPGMDENAKWRITGCSLSGEWWPDDRQPPVYSGRELRHALFVPMEGFPVRRAQALAASASDDDLMPLVAAGALIPTAVDPDDIVITIRRAFKEDPMAASTDTIETTEASDVEAVTASAPTVPSFGKDDVVRIPEGATLGMVASVEGGRAIVQVEVPADGLIHATAEDRQELSASARERLMDTKLSTALEKIEQMQSQMESMVASAQAQQRGAQALNTLTAIPE